MLNTRTGLLGSLAVFLLGLFASAQATEFSAADYDLYPGDFNHDGLTDILYIAKNPGSPSGIALADASGHPQTGFQSWPSNYLNIPWSDGSYKAIIGDFNNDGCADIFLQPQTPGNAYVLLTNCNPANGPVGQIQAIAQAIPQNAYGIAWSADQHKILAGDFNGDGFTDLFFQAVTGSGNEAIVLAQSNGNMFCALGVGGATTCWNGAPQQTWANSYNGFKWSAQSADIVVGNFGGPLSASGRPIADLLIRENPVFVIIPYDIPFPVPTFAPQPYGLFPGMPPDGSGAIIRSPNQLWDNTNDLGAKAAGSSWSTLSTNVIVADFNDDGISDVILQSKNGAQPNLLVTLNGSTGQFQTAAALSGPAGSSGGSSYRLLAGSFGGSSGSGLYLQATTEGGNNYTSASASSGPLTQSTMQFAGTTTLPATGVGATSATADVSASGTAQYSIPFKFPQGTAGLTPQLGLQYQHSSPNGLPGIGWSVIGFSAMTRCPETIAQDGVVQGVQLIAADQYCLDGNRLRLSSSNSAAPGTDGAQYRTELETFDKIVAHGTGTNGPVWFEVFHKDGTTSEYGNTADSRILVSGTSTTREWAISKTHDRANNYIAFSYINNATNPVSGCSESNSNGSYRPCQVRYGGNSAQGISPPYTVQFNYQNRNPGEYISRWVDGGFTQESNRLLNVQLLYASAVIHQYVLGYEAPLPQAPANPSGSLTNFSRLTSVQECGANSSCFKPTTFSWSNQAVASGQPALSSTKMADYAFSTSTVTYEHAPVTADINGDGVVDTIWFGTIAGSGGTPIKIYLGAGPGQTQSAGITVPSFTNAGYVVGVTDLDNDGKDDILFFDDSGPTARTLFWLHQRASDGAFVYEQVSGWGSTYIDSPYPLFMDVDGDGFKDIVWAPEGDTQHLKVIFHNHDGSPGFITSASYAWTAPAGKSIAPLYYQYQIAWQTHTQLKFADIDGDGRQDLLVQLNNGWQVLYSNGSGFDTGELLQPKVGTSGNVTVYATPVPIDINGDGCTDFAYPSNTSPATWTLAISRCGRGTGSGLQIVTTTLNSPNSTTYVSAMDWNGDGYQDLLDATNTGGSTAQLVYLSTGSTLSASFTNGTNVNASGLASAWADRNGDGIPDYNDSLGNYQLALGPKGNLLTSIADGYGNTATFAYAPLTNSTMYTRGNAGIGKTQDVNGAVYVVSQMTSTDGIGGTYSLQYQYKKALRNVQGRGFLGFGIRIITDSRAGIVTTETYNNTLDSSNNGWELIGSLYESQVTQSTGGPLVSDTVNTWQSIVPTGSPSSRYPYDRLKTETRYELGISGAIATGVTTTTIDGYGTPTDISVTTTEGVSGQNPGSSRTVDTSMSNVTNDTTDWCLNKPQTITTTSSTTLPGGTAASRAITNMWDFVNCRITSRQLDQGSGYSLTTALGYDAYNNINTTSVSGDNIVLSSTGFDYATNAVVPGLLLMSTANALTQKIYYTWDVGKGVRLSRKDLNGLQTTWEYDDFGRPVHELDPDGTGSRSTYSPCSSTNGYCGDSQLRYMVQMDQRDTNDAIVSYKYVFYDSLSRPRYQESLAFNSPMLSIIETLYDNRGNVASNSMPYLLGSDPNKGTTFTYDLLNRPIQTQRPAGDADSTIAKTMTTYAGLTITRVDEMGNSGVTVLDAWGERLWTTDAAHQNTHYTYDSFGDLKSVTDPAGNVTTQGYNVRGVKISSSDPDLGSWSYSVDALGRVYSQTDNHGQTTKFHYDVLGRMDNRTDWGATSPDTTWSWDTAANGIGKLGSVTGTGGFSESYAYDSHSRQSGTSTTIAGNTYTTQYSYDPTLGLPLSVVYPTRASGNALTTTYEYQNGFLKDVKDQTGKVYWQALAEDARGHVTQEQLGNGQQGFAKFDDTTGRLEYVQSGASGGAYVQNLSYTWDLAGNLLTRADGVQGLIEGFGYDALYRLTSAQLNGASTLSVTYDALGNISTKSNVGSGSHSYDYTTAQAACTYTGNAPQPHAVRNAAGNVYCYDQNGNMTSRAGTTVSWYPYNLPQTINGSSGNSSTFYYDPDRARYRQVSTTGGTQEDRIYVGGVFERATSASGTITYRQYIQASGKTVAIQDITSNSGAETVQTYYPYTDHLGSTDVVTDASGNVVTRESFDAWGQRRNGSSWTGSPADLSTIDGVTRRGFTGQEHLDNLNLVNLNGRVYDPGIGRFLSADPVVQAPFHSQSLNRYSYVWNNPLNGTDPTGFEAAQECTGTHIKVPSGSSCTDVVPYMTRTGGVSGPANPSRAGNNSLSSGQGNGAQEDPTALNRQVSNQNQRSDPDSGSSTEVAHGEPMEGVTVTGGRERQDVPFFPSLSDVTRNAFNSAYRHELGRIHWSEVVDGIGLGVVKLAFGWIDCAGGRCSATQEAFALASAPFAAIALPEDAELLAAREVVGLGDLAKFRAGLGLEAGEGTLAKLEAGGQEFYGINAHGQPITMNVNAISRTHAEADAFQQALNAGVRGGDATLYVDRALCMACGTNGGVASMARQLGFDQLTIITPQATHVIVP